MPSKPLSEFEDKSQKILTNFKLAVQKKGGYGYEESLAQLKKLFAEQILELIDDSMPQGSYHVNTEVLQNKIKERYL